ncbi:MAG: UvrD-helicase domain-containing protein [Prevotella copri]|uniref:ATP-dependent helicase n=1 Tax=Segatella copri TaxID=165179 RepID=UPI0028027B39|nr:UvrD-helicase domain-containing protein [Segatella copri]MDD7001865.1 UvrD-helicase domain-containing protein [Segatella copri]MDY6203778.1 UvrD-helicase domain-containing protein [Segatella copri]
MDLLNDLNDAQRAAVEYIDGPSLVIAGAGSGKTRVLTYKIAYLLSQGMKPWSIMALTFTNKAAREMKERIGKLVGGDLAQHLYMGTFHSIFSRILRAEAEHIGFNNNFTIYDESDSRSLLKAIIKEMGLDDKAYKPAAVHARISMAKNNLVTAEAYDSDPAILEQNKRAKMPAIGKIYVAYVQRCRQANAMDFDDLLMLTFQLFRDHEEIRQKYAGRFDYILVDEYQDTNHVQMSIVMQLCKEKLRVCAVGDDSQSIYSFRGANIDNILNYQKQLPGTQLFKLEQNYRSTQTIVEAANSLIHHNRNQIQKEVFSKNDKGEKILYKPAYSDKEEALIVAKNIQRIKRQDDCGYDQFAILYRTNAQSRSFEEEFRKQGIPYRIYGGLSFYQRKEIKDIIAYFRLVANPDDEEAFKRIINYPARGIGATTVMKIADCAHQNQVSFWEVIGNVEHYGLNVNKGTQTKLEKFRLLISSFIDRSHTLDVYELGDAIIRESRISEDIMSGKNADDLARQENLEEFLSGMQTFVAGRQEEGRMDEAYLTDYLQDVALLTDADSEGEKDEPRVSLMTIHAAKGLEFATVFVVGLEENIFPSPLAAISVRELEEERRLLYVAITRAEKHCILTNAKNRFRYGKMEFDNPSRFIDEIDASLIEGGEEAPESSFGGGRSSYGGYGSEGGYGGRMPWDRDRSGYRRDYQNSKPVASQFMADPKPAFASSAAGSLCEGCRIEHQRFGIGTVLKIEGTGENTKATVEFQNAGTKQLLLKFAKFTILS